MSKDAARNKVYAEPLRRRPERARRQRHAPTEAAPEPVLARAPVIPPGLRHALPPGRTHPLPQETREEMEARFGEDFSAVSVHDDTAAHDLARAHAAKAYALGEHLVFGSGRFAPHTAVGRGLLAHELAHVVQQRRRGGSPPGSLEGEADHAAASSGPVTIRGSAPAGVPMFDVDESQLVRPKVEVVADGKDEVIVIQGIRAFRVRPKEAGQALKRDAFSAGSYTRLKGKEYSPAPGVSVSWRWTTTARYAQAVELTQVPGSVAALRRILPSVEFVAQVSSPPPKPPVPARQDERKKLKGALREVGRKDLDKPASGFDFPAMPKMREPGTCGAATETGRRYAEEEAAQKQVVAARLMDMNVQRGVSLIDSVAGTHWTSRKELEKHIQDYLAAVQRVAPEKLAQAQADQKLVLEELEANQVDLVQEDITQAIGEADAARKTQTIQSLTPTPWVVKRNAAIGEAVVIPVIKGVDFISNFIPYVGQVKMLIEGVTGRTISGQIDLAIQTGKGFEDLPMDLDTVDRLIRIVPAAISGAAKIVAKAPGWGAALKQLRTSTGLGEAALGKQLAEITRLAGREREIAKILVKLRNAWRNRWRMPQYAVTPDGRLIPVPRPPQPGNVAMMEAGGAGKLDPKAPGYKDRWLGEKGAPPRPQTKEVTKTLEQNRPWSSAEVFDALRKRIQQYRRSTGIKRTDPPDWASGKGGGEPVQGGVVAVAKTDVHALRGKFYGGASPEAVPKALKGSPGTTASTLKPTGPLAENHGEAVALENLGKELSGLDAAALKNKRVWVLVEQEPCPSCASGIGTDAVSGPIKQFSQRFPDLTVEVQNLRTSRSYFIQNGKPLPGTQ